MGYKGDKQSQYYELVDTIKRIPIVEIYNHYIGGKLRLHHVGHKATASCPWHGRDSSPSLTLYTDRGNWYCFGCQRGGTVIDLVMTALGVDFKSAVAAIARDFGLRDLQPDPALRQKIHKAKEQRNIEVSFAADYDRIYLKLVNLHHDIKAKLKTFEDYEKYPELVHQAPVIEAILQDLSNASTQAEKVQAWREARKVFTWLKTI